MAVLILIKQRSMGIKCRILMGWDEAKKERRNAQGISKAEAAG